MVSIASFQWQRPGYPKKDFMKYAYNIWWVSTKLRMKKVQQQQQTLFKTIKQQLDLTQVDLLSVICNHARSNEMKFEAVQFHGINSIWTNLIVGGFKANREKTVYSRAKRFARISLQQIYRIPHHKNTCIFFEFHTKNGFFVCQDLKHLADIQTIFFFISPLPWLNTSISWEASCFAPDTKIMDSWKPLPKKCEDERIKNQTKHGLLCFTAVERRWIAWL